MRKNIILTAIFLAFSVVAAKAQQIVNVSQKDNSIIVEYDLSSPAEFVRLYVSLDGGENYRGPLTEVSGDLNNVPAGYNHSITWNILKEFNTDAFEEDNVRFKLSVKLKEKWYKETFVTINGAYSFLPQPSFGFSVGQVWHFGWFVSVMTNGKFDGYNYEIDCVEGGYTPEGYLPAYIDKENGGESRMRLSVIGGGILRISGPLCARIGVGYGYRTLRCQVIDGTWNRIKPSTFEGIDLSAGLQLNLSGFVVSLEAVTTQFQTVEGKLGLGLSF